MKFFTLPNDEVLNRRGLRNGRTEIYFSKGACRQAAWNARSLGGVLAVYCGKSWGNRITVAQKNRRQKNCLLDIISDDDCFSVNSTKIVA
jgi:hypothetical protein